MATSITHPVAMATSIIPPVAVVMVTKTHPVDTTSSLFYHLIISQLFSLGLVLYCSLQLVSSHHYDKLSWKLSSSKAIVSKQISK